MSDPKISIDVIIEKAETERGRYRFMGEGREPGKTTYFFTAQHNGFFRLGDLLISIGDDIGVTLDINKNYKLCIFEAEGE